MKLIALCMVTLAIVAGPTPASASADTVLSLEDKRRLAAFDRTRATAIVEARRNGDPRAVDALDAILAGTPQRVLGESLSGDYRCRLAKLDGILPVIVYSWFRCTIEEDGPGYRLTKVSGSQRTTLRFIDEGETRLIAYGAGYYQDEQPKRYGEDPDRNQVGYLVKPEGGRYRIEFPLPTLESRFDILELERR
ncbi:MAG TPA: DUF4893 domain-containing protein [Methylomirabilota bacterium]|nr:DUF4893 domain-containing protein [Methylomirabilota bacterium]